MTTSARRLESAAMDVATKPQARGQYTARVLLNQPLCREHFKLVVRLSNFPATAPGQFIQLSCAPADGSDEPEFDWPNNRRPCFTDESMTGAQAVLRRPFSLAGRTDSPDGVDLEIIHRVVGIGTQWLSELEVGDSVSLIGPLGNRFVPPPLQTTALLVGGGVGIPPMIYLARAWGRQHKCIAFCGALTRDLMPLELRDVHEEPAIPAMRAGEFADFSVPTIFTTDDGTLAQRGYITDALERYLSVLSPQSVLVYTCGPEPMMKRVAAIAANRGIECQVAVERAMACGMGTCQSCCIRLKRDPSRDGRAFAGKDWIYKLACTDGPVFKGADLLW